MPSEDSLTVWDESLDRIREAGDRLMSFSDLKYEGSFVSVSEFERVHVMEFGEGPPVILMHGAGMGGPVWHRQISALAHDHRVIVPDIPMFGLSDMPRRVYAPREQISDVILGVMDQFEIEKADIAGHSLGAIGSLGAMIDAPERFTRAILMGSPGFGRGLNCLLRLASIPAFRRLISSNSRRGRDLFFDHCEAQKSGSSEEREAWKEMVYRISSRNYATDAFFEGLRRITGFFGQRDILSDETLSAVKIPTLLVWGDSDRIVPTGHSCRASRTIPNSRLQIIENCGHVVQLEAPRRVTQLMVDWFRVS